MPIEKASCDNCKKPIHGDFAITKAGSILCETCVIRDNLENTVQKWCRIEKEEQEDQPAEEKEEPKKKGQK